MSRLFCFLRLGWQFIARELLASIVIFAFYCMAHCLRYQTNEILYRRCKLILGAITEEKNCFH